MDSTNDAVSLRFAIRVSHHLNASICGKFLGSTMVNFEGKLNASHVKSYIVISYLVTKPYVWDLAPR